MSLPCDVDHRHEGRIRDRDQGISRNIDLFMEELRREQEAREKWNAELEKRRNEFRSQNIGTENGTMIPDDTEGAGEKDEEDWEEEYVVLDLDDVFHGAPVPNFAYTLSGLDTLNPILTLDNGLKLIGQYTETIGTTVVYSEKGRDVLEGQADIRELPIPADPYPANTVKKPLKRIRGVCKLERKLKFCAMPIQFAPANGMFMQSAYVQTATPAGDSSLINAMPVGDAARVNAIPVGVASHVNAASVENTSHINDMPMKDASLHRTAQTEDDSLENARPTKDVALENALPREYAPMGNARATEGASLENATATEDASVDNARATEDTSLETVTATEDASVANATTKGASVEKLRAMEGSSLENTTATEGASLENATATEDVSLEKAIVTEGALLEKATAVEEALPENVKVAEDALLEITGPTEDASLGNATLTEDSSK